MTESITENEKRFPIQLTICAEPQLIAVARGAVRAYAEQTDLSANDIDKIILAISEALTNIIRHSYQCPCDKPIYLAMRETLAGPDQRPALEWLIRDFGRTVDPDSIQGRDLDDIKPGGLGLHIIRATMDIVDYQQPRHQGMVLRLVKYLDSPAAPCD